MISKKKIIVSLNVFILLVFSFSCSNDQENSQQAKQERNKIIDAQQIKEHTQIEKYRPVFHFTPPEKWMNDPNGMFYFEGEYHLFYQYYPDDIVWGPMHWGHAVSNDLVHWEHLPIALYPDELGYIFSGSAIVDWKNSTGFGEDGKPPIIAIFTYHDPIKEKAGKVDVETQGLAYSLDKGRTWTKYEGNPVLKNPGIRDFRDPKVIWFEKENKWLMVLSAHDRVRFYESRDLKSWTFLSDFGAEIGAHGGVWECPDFFPLKVENGNEIKWVLLQSLNPGAPNGGSGTFYFVGDFDGQTFTLDPSFLDDVKPVPEKEVSGRIFADFESMSYDVWAKEGFAMGNGPVKGSVVRNQLVEGYVGDRLVNSFFGSDEPTGKLTSPTFIVESSYINFKIGGGDYSDQLGMDLIINNEVVRKASGQNSNKLVWHSWNVEEFIGQSAKMVIKDSRTESWGFVLVDHIMFADHAATPVQEKAVWLDYGKDNYAGVTWSDAPGNQSEKYFIGWMSNWQYAQEVPTKSWRSAMTIPRMLTLKKSKVGFRLKTLPVPSIDLLRKNKKVIENLGANKLIDYEWENNTVVGEINASLDLYKCVEDNFGFVLENKSGDQILVGYDMSSKRFYIDRRNVQNHQFNDQFSNKVSWSNEQNIDGNLINLQILIDVSSVEVFARNGNVVMTEIFFPEEEFSHIKTFSKKGEVNFNEITVHQY